MTSGRRPFNQYTGWYHVLQCGHQETVYIGITMAELHGLEVKAADVLNAYVMAPHKGNL